MKQEQHCVSFVLTGTDSEYWTSCSDQYLEYAVTEYKTLNWETSQTYCLRFGSDAHLATPRNIVEKSCIHELIYGERKNVWIGISNAEDDKLVYFDDKKAVDQILQKQTVLTNVSRSTKKGECVSAWTVKKHQNGLRDVYQKWEYTDCEEKLKAICQRQSENDPFCDVS